MSLQQRITALAQAVGADIKQLQQASTPGSFFSLVTVAATSASQTSFTIPGGYTPGAIVVFLNGSSLAPAHYTATNGTAVVLGSGTGVVVGSELVVLRLSAFEVADALPLGGTAADSSKLGGRAAADYEALYGRAGTAGALGFRNKIINGDMRINQRLFNGTWTGLAEGAYGFDRWKRSGTNIQQVIEEGNFKPNTVHTLSGTGVTTQQITSPASGHWTITVPNTATNVQIEEGTVATPFEHRPIGVELALCQRYFEAGSIPYAAASNGAGGFKVTIAFLVSKAFAPTMNVGYSRGGGAVVVGIRGFHIYDMTDMAIVNSWLASSEL